MKTNRFMVAQFLAALLVLCLASGASAASGTLKTWGSNSYGAPGDASESNKLTPVDVLGLSGVIMVTGGDDQTVALKSDGTVWQWGGYYAKFSKIPLQVKDPKDPSTFLKGVVAIACGARHNVALKSDGTVRTWGDNGEYQLGDGTTTDRMTPVKVSGLTGIIAISCGEAHTAALKNDGTVWSWGRNWRGQLGDGTEADNPVPVQASGLSGVTAIACGYMHTIALMSNGTLMGWGQNSYGELGNSGWTSCITPVAAGNGISGVKAISAGNDTYALKENGELWAWGGNASKLGIGDDRSFMDYNTPQQISTLTGVASVSTGYDHTIAMTSDGKVWAWGVNSGGQLGDGTTTHRSSPVQVSGLTAGGVIAAIACYGPHSYAIVKNGIELSFTQQGRTVTLSAKGYKKGSPLSTKPINFYKKKWDSLTGTWSAWALLGHGTTGADGSVSKSFSIASNGIYRFQAKYITSTSVMASPATPSCTIAPVKVIYPAADAVVSSPTCTATWNSYLGATGYVIQTSPASTFTSPSETPDLGNVTSANLPALTQGVKTYWRVIAILPTGRSVPSAARAITYQ